MNKLQRATTVLLCAMCTQIAISDSWSYKPELRERTLEVGGVRFVMGFDSRENSRYPREWMDMYKKDVLVARYPGVSFSAIYESLDHRYFLGLSNSGLPNVAAFLFDDTGHVLLFADHDRTLFDYCTESSSLVKVWYDDKNPDVSFVLSEYGEVQTVKLRDCHGNMVELFDLIATVTYRHMTTQAKIKAAIQAAKKTTK